MSQVQVEQKNYQMPPQDGFTVAHFLTVSDIERSARFCQTTFGASHSGAEAYRAAARQATSRSRTRGSLSTSGRSDTRQTIGNAERPRRPRFSQQLYDYPRCGYSSVL